MMEDSFFQPPADEVSGLVQLDDSDLYEEVADDFEGEEAFADEATTVFSEQQVQHFMDEGTVDEPMDPWSEEEDHTAIYDASAHAPPPAPAPTPRAATVGMVAQRPPKATGRAAAMPSSAGPWVAQPAHSAPIPRRQTTGAQVARPAFQEEATVVTEGAAFHAAAHRVQQAAAPAPRQQRVTAEPVAVPAGRPPAAPTAPGWSPVQVVLGLVLALALGAVLVIGWQLLQRTPSGTPATATGGTLAIFTTPAGASVRVGTTHGSTPTPLVVGELPLQTPLPVVIELAGYQTLNDVIILADSGVVQKQYTLVAEPGVLVIETTPPGAIVSLNGQERGPAPQTLGDLDRSRTYQLSATLDGYRSADQTVRWESDAPNQQTLQLTLVQDQAPPPPAAEPEPTPEPPAAAAAPEPTPEPAARAAAPRTETNTRTVAAPTPARERPSARTAETVPTSRERPSARAAAEPTPTRERPSARAQQAAAQPTAAAGGTATISVQAVPYGQVWIDGRMVARETPLLNHTLPAGAHRVKVYFESLRSFSDERTIRLEPGTSQSVTFRAPR